MKKFYVTQSEVSLADRIQDYVLPRSKYWAGGANEHSMSRIREHRRSYSFILLVEALYVLGW